MVGARIILGLPGLERHLVAVRKNPAQPTTCTPWHSLSHDGLYAELVISSSRKPACFATVEPVHSPHSGPMAENRRRDHFLLPPRSTRHRLRLKVSLTR